MMYPNYPYGIFDQELLRAYQQQQEAQRQCEQNKNIYDMTKALHDFLDASQKVHPDYQQMAYQACFAVIADHMQKNNGGQQK